VCFFSFLLIDFIHPKATTFFPITSPILGWCITGHSRILAAVDHLGNALLFLEWVRPFQKRKSEQQDSMRVAHLYAVIFFQKITTSAGFPAGAQIMQENSRTQQKQRKSIRKTCLQLHCQTWQSQGFICLHPKLILVQFCTTKKTSWYSFVPTCLCRVSSKNREVANSRK